MSTDLVKKLQFAPNKFCSTTTTDYYADTFNNMKSEFNNMKNSTYPKVLLKKFLSCLTV